MNNETLIALLGVFIFTVILLILTYCYRKQSGGTKWQCLPGIGSPLRRNPQTGNIECMSSDGKNCSYQCPDTTPVCPEKPLACGCDHLKQWGSTGYNDPSHWCSTCDSQFKESSFW